MICLHRRNARRSIQDRRAAQQRRRAVIGRHTHLKRKRSHQKSLRARERIKRPANPRRTRQHVEAVRQINRWTGDRSPAVAIDGRLNGANMV